MQKIKRGYPLLIVAVGLCIYFRSNRSSSQEDAIHNRQLLDEAQGMAYDAEAKIEKYNVDKIAALESTIFSIMKKKRQIENLQAETNKMYEELAGDTPARLLDPQKYYYVDDAGNVQQKMHGNNVASSDNYEKLE